MTTAKALLEKLSRSERGFVVAGFALIVTNFVIATIALFDESSRVLENWSMSGSTVGLLVLVIVLLPKIRRKQDSGSDQL
jgi:hypothetical protein